MVHPDLNNDDNDTLTTEVHETTTNVSLIDVISLEECFNLEGELESHTAFLQSDPIANRRIKMKQTPHPKSRKVRKNKVPTTKQVALTAFINLREGRLSSEFNERQARVLMGIEYPKLNSRGKVDKCWTLDRLSKKSVLPIRTKHLHKLLGRRAEIRIREGNVAHL